MTRQGPGAASGPASAVWRWSVERSPLARAWRAFGRALHRQRGAAALVASSGLPQDIRTRIDAIVRRTRLWHDERTEIARELIAHAEDALGAGRDTTEVTASLGEPATIAPLLRRSAKRKRSVLAKARAYTARSIGVMALVLVVGYAALAVRFFTSEPTVTTNYIALLNERHAGLGENEKAWPVYEAVLAAWRPERLRLSRESVIHGPGDPPAAAVREGHPFAGADDLGAVTPAHPDFALIAEAFHELRPKLDIAMDATRRPALGFAYTDRPAPSDDPDRAHQDATIPDDAGLSDMMLIDLLLPHLTGARQVARVLQFDARLAAEEGDGARAAAAIEAMLNLSAQLGREPFLISSLVAIAVHTLAADTVTRVLDQNPGTFTSAHLERLERRFEGTRDRAIVLDLESESYFFEDFLQRAFSDDGRGGGRMTPAGLAMLSGLRDDGVPLASAEVRMAHRLAGPLGMATVADRRSQSALYARMREAAERTLCDGPHTIGVLSAEFHDRFETMGLFEQTRYLPVYVLSPALQHAVNTAFIAQARSDAARVLLALERHRLEEGALPESVALLAPRYLASVPEDPFDPGGTIKYRRDAGSRHGFVLYYVGANGVDNGGTAAHAQARRASPMNFLLRYHTPPGPGGRYWRPSPSAPDGDWVIFPPESAAR